MNLDAAMLARVQFAFTVSFHIIFPTISIGLAMFLAVMEGLWLKTKDPVYLQIYRFWLGIFAMAFGVGVVTGIGRDTASVGMSSLASGPLLQPACKALSWAA
jgi:cytochrome d ubiquinol oxidase subunit I